MFINPKKGIEEGWITGIKNPDVQVQPNAIDFTLDRLFTIQPDNMFIITEQDKKMRGGEELIPVTDRAPYGAFWTISTGVFDGMSDIHVELPEGVAAQLIIRSTFNRNGVFLTSGLYDSGFKGNIGFAIHNNVGLSKIGVGTRVGQIMFIASDSAGVYAGGYNTEAGEHWADADNSDG